MRDIKFRVWDTTENMFLTKLQLEAVHDSISWGTNFFLEIREDIENYDPTRYVFCQSTGLKDKNGKEIYEGDIVSYANKDNRVVEWTPYGYEPWACDGEGDHECHSGWHMGREVIGNIWENPELLTPTTKLDV